MQGVHRSKLAFYQLCRVVVTGNAGIPAGVEYRFLPLPLRRRSRLFTAQRGGLIQNVLSQLTKSKPNEVGSIWKGRAAA